jgi:hypothetical protein
MWNNKNSYSLLVGEQNDTATVEIWQFLTKLNVLLAFNPAIMLHGIYPKELKTFVHTETFFFLVGGDGTRN